MLSLVFSVHLGKTTLKRFHGQDQIWIGATVVLSRRQISDYSFSTPIVNHYYDHITYNHYILTTLHDQTSIYYPFRPTSRYNQDLSRSDSGKPSENDQL